MVGLSLGCALRDGNELLVISEMARMVCIRDGKLMIEMVEELVASSWFRICILIREGFVDCYSIDSGTFRYSITHLRSN